MSRRNVVKFIDHTGTVAEEFYPRPARLDLPDWYKRSDSYIDGKRRVFGDDQIATSSTVKKCMPLYDAMSVGYLLYTPADIDVSIDRDGHRLYQWPSHGVEFHNRRQLVDYPLVQATGNIPKIVSPWIVVTPPGYSCHFLPPAHRPTPMRIFEGIVDTDRYQQQVNLPFQLVDEDFVGIIPAGTPLAQVIPFRRDAYTLEVVPTADEAEVKRGFHRLRATFFNGYKDRFWAPKDYR